MNQVKPGYKTTEFWMSAFTTIGSLVATYQGIIPPPWGIVAAAVCTFGYTAARAFTKGNTPVITGQPADAPAAGGGQ